jgi:hypothetical protein
MDVCVAIVISLCPSCLFQDEIATKSDEMNIYTRPTALEKKLAKMKKKAAKLLKKKA